MKNLEEFIIDSNIEEGIEQLTNLFKSTMLNDINLSESDFKESNGVYTIENISKDTKDAEDFYNGAAKLSKATISTKSTTSEARIALVQSGKDDIYVKLNVEADTNRLHVKINKVISAEISKEIKEKLV